MTGPLKGRLVVELPDGRTASMPFELVAGASVEHVEQLLPKMWRQLVGLFKAGEAT